MKRRNWITLAVLVVAMLLLAGCGVPHEGVDVRNTAPDGFWQQFVVWPLANMLIAIETFLANIGVFYAWGWAIIVFTFLVKLVTFPLTLKQTQGMQAQKDLQPRLQELQKKYGKDREKLAAEQMKLYQEAGVNPMSGCLPLLIQMPILFGLYAALVGSLGPNLEGKQIQVIPGGLFWYLPWDVLRDGQGRYLVESLEWSCVSPSELLRSRFQAQPAGPIGQLVALGGSNGGALDRQLQGLKLPGQFIPVPSRKLDLMGNPLL